MKTFFYFLFSGMTMIYGLPAIAAAADPLDCEISTVSAISIPDPVLLILYQEAALEWESTAEEMQQHHASGRLVIEDLGNDTYKLTYGGEIIILIVEL